LETGGEPERVPPSGVNTDNLCLSACVQQPKFFWCIDTLYYSYIV
jgi:hypothetical protein